MELDKLRKLQLTELEILDEIVRICNKHSIAYYLIGGTLLGAIRHKGFIPWDDDLDIVMPRDAYYNFRKVCETELNSSYFLQDFSSEKNHFLPFSKVRKNETIFEEKHMTNIDVHKGIFVDIFLLDNASNQSSLFQNFQHKQFKFINRLIWYKTIIKEKKVKSLKEKIIVSLTTPFKLEKLSRIQQSIMSINKNKKSLYYVNLGSQYGIKKQTIPKVKYFPPSKVEFEGKLYNAPKDYNYVLSKVFGDYMKLPPEDKRVTHNPVKLKFEDENEIIF